MALQDYSWVEAMQEELRQFVKLQAWQLVPLPCGVHPIGTRWVDINKGDNVHPEFRSRVVGQEIKVDRRDDLFAATPPLEAMKFLLSLAVTEGIGYVKGGKKSGKKLDFIDIRRACYHALARREVYVKLPPGDQEEGMCGLLVAARHARCCPELGKGLRAIHE